MREGTDKKRSRLRRDGPKALPDFVQAFLPYIYDYTCKEDDTGHITASIIEKLMDSPIPLSTVMTYARRAGFGGIPLLEQAARSNAGNAFEGLFEEAGGGDGSGLREDSPSSKADPGKRVKEEFSKTSPVGISSVREAFEKVFSELGERRGQQVEMGAAVDSALRDGRIAFIEAGTGTGKSLGYLVPAVLFSKSSGKRVVVSTHTKNLQNQLFEREIPLISRILSLEVKAGRLMGRENYICSRRLCSEVSRLGNSDPGLGLELALRAAFSATGTVDSIGSVDMRIPPGSLQAPRRCMMNACFDSDTCPLIKARKRALSSEILFVNHALVLADYSGGGSVMGEYAGVIFDEAHHLERCVMENLSIRISPQDVRNILKPVRPVSMSTESWKLLESQLEAYETEGGLKAEIGKIASLAYELEKAWEEIFSSMKNGLNPDRAVSSTRTRYYCGEETFAYTQNAVDAYLLYSNQIKISLKLLYEAKGSSAAKAFQQELEICCKLFEELEAALSFLREAGDEDTVYWMEWNSRGGISSICGSPLSVDRRFADYLNDCCESAVFTSATLSQEQSFEYIRGSLGIHLTGFEVGELIEPSSLIRDDNFLVILHGKAGNPNHDDFAREISFLVRELSSRTGRRLLALFTSYRMCLLAAKILEREDLPGPLLVQGRGLSRESLSSSFRKLESSILLGVASFWEGVDFPGDQLEILVIPKIPFPVPDEPIVEAKAERIKALGKNPFQELFLPEAVLRLRQGIGRLIRRKDDRGVAIIMDSRLSTMPYGRRVLASLPTGVVEVSSSKEVVERSAEWFERNHRGREA